MGLSPNTNNRHSEPISESVTNFRQFLKQVQEDEKQVHQSLGDSHTMLNPIEEPPSRIENPYSPEMVANELTRSITNAIWGLFVRYGKKNPDPPTYDEIATILKEIGMDTIVIPAIIAKLEENRRTPNKKKEYAALAAEEENK